ncbi:hypothetical protein AB0C02_19530 [Micromonospora sp. NPDC048999]|uniref:hypothetical protein n=1 Tax=Micromonospora sp. NPDC048999 TaxID=3155391 RepID=UPI0034049015
MKTGDVLHLTRAASPQFTQSIFLRVIRTRTDFHTYDGWTWLDGYQLNQKGEAVARRELYVLKEGVQLVCPFATPQPPNAKTTSGSDSSA